MKKARLLKTNLEVSLSNEHQNLKMKCHQLIPLPMSVTQKEGGGTTFTSSTLLDKPRHEHH